ncbi:hypothetical protein ACTHPF_04800 [Paenibacillus sp. SAF-054]|uniref:hypothetical protein n=1 Tax=unclassified Paenibacillus TaxID=185978 RepID=UPI003F7DAAF0
MNQVNKRLLLIIFAALTALLGGCSASSKQTVPQESDPDAILKALFDVEHIKSAKSVITHPLSEISEIEDHISIRYQYAFLVKGAVDEKNNAVPNKLYITSAVENTKKGREISIRYIDGGINGEIRKQNPKHRTFTVNPCGQETGSDCEDGQMAPYEAEAVIFSVDDFPELKPQQNVVDISVKYALANSKKELREQFLSDRGLQERDKAEVSLKLPMSFY